MARLSSHSQSSVAAEWIILKSGPPTMWGDQNLPIVCFHSPLWTFYSWLLYSLSFLVVMYGSESWTIKKAEHQRTDGFQLWCWRRHLRVPWTAERSKQSILKEINPEYSLEGLMLKLTLQYYGHLIWRADSLEKTLILGKIEGRRRGWQDQFVGWITHSMDMSLSKLWGTGKLGMLQSMGS